MHTSPSELLLGGAHQFICIILEPNFHCNCLYYVNSLFAPKLLGVQILPVTPFIPAPASLGQKMLLCRCVVSCVVALSGRKPESSGVSSLHAEPS